MGERRIADLLPWLRLGCAGAAGAAWYLFPDLGPWSLALALAPWLLALPLTGRPFRRTLLDLPLLIFLLTAGASLAFSYDPDGALAIFPVAVGWRKLWGLILSVLVFYALVAFESEKQRRRMMALLAGLGAAVGLWFLVSNDWADHPADLAFITRLGEALQSLMPYVPGHRLNSNVAGGLIALFIPLSLELVTSETSTRWWRVAGGLTGSVMAFGLFMTSSRGAWVGLAGALTLAVLWWLVGKLRRGRHRFGVFVALIGAVALFGGVVLFAVPALRSAILDSPDMRNRLRIISQFLPLVRDYAFTGAGLGVTPLVHSTYSLLLHVAVLVHSHTLFLDVAIEQGVIGASAMVIAWAMTGWLGLRRLDEAQISSAQPLLGPPAGLLSLVVLIIHGLSDDALYGSRGLLLMWMPLGLVFAGLPKRTAPVSRLRWRLVGAAIGVIFLLGLILARPLAAVWNANLGAVVQTQLELPQYDPKHFDDPTMDEIRRRTDLSVAEEYYERALELDPGQVTARTRLAQIALSRGEYEIALTHAQVAWDSGHRDRVTRLTLGDALVANGYPDEVAALVRGLEHADGRLAGQAFYRYTLGEDWQRAAWAWRVILDLNPGNPDIMRRFEEAEERVGD